jgi:hypothetical protein
MHISTSQRSRETRRGLGWLVTVAHKVAGARVPVTDSERKNETEGKGKAGGPRSYHCGGAPYTLQKAVASILCVDDERSIWWPRSGHRAACLSEEDDDILQSGIRPAVGLRQPNWPIPLFSISSTLLFSYFAVLDY